MKQQLIDSLQKIILELTGIEIPIPLEIPTDFSHGDYTTNVAFSLVKRLKKSPFEIATEIVSKFQSQTDTKYQILNTKYIAKVEAVTPGFINFYLSQEYLLHHLEGVTAPLADATFQMAANGLLAGGVVVGNSLAGKKISVEFTDPNPFKEFHIGHLYTNTVGEAVSRLFEANGATVWRANYFSDVGMHVAKAIYGILQISNIQYPISNKNGVKQLLEKLAEQSLPDRIVYLGKAYAYGTQVFEESDPSTNGAKEAIKKLNKLIFIAAQQMWQKEKGIVPTVDYQKGEKIDADLLQEVYQLYIKGRAWSLEYFDSMYARLGMHFDGYYPESIAAEQGYTLVQDHITDGIFEKSDGAVIFSKEKSNVHTRVFINSLGLPTYEAKELGLAPWKYEEFAYDESYIITGNEITEYFKVLIAAMNLINPALGKKTHHVGHGMVRLPEGKMSSRTGKIITAQWVLDKAVKKAEGLSKYDNKQIAQEVGVGAVKYALLKTGIGRDIEFDFDTSLSLQGNSGPYLQYTYVRTQSILEKSKAVILSSNEGYSQEDSSHSVQNDMSSEESLLLRLINQFADVVEDAGKNMSPSTLCTYLYQLAQVFNLFYQTHRVLGESVKRQGESNKEKDLNAPPLTLHPSQEQFRLSVTAGVGTILAQGLHILGIVAPKEM